VKLYTYWRSQATFRVRIALNLKGLKHEDFVVNLERGDQFTPEYRKENPQAVVPTLYDGKAKLFQSVAILEYLEEKYPEPPILPRDPLARAWVRGFALINVADSHPLIVPRIRNYLADVLKIDEAQRLAWIRHWLAAGLGAMEELLAEKNPTGKFCHGDSPTMADICLMTQVTPAQLFKTDLAPYKRVTRIYDHCMTLPAFAEAHPRKQPDFEGH
jgi:maleylacetoacetate isomerase